MNKLGFIKVTEKEIFLKVSSKIDMILPLLLVVLISKESILSEFFPETI